jgi:glycosyltransferase involved in cell wall biosynthesis
MKKILIIAPSRKMGGIERALSVLSNGFIKKNVKVTYVSCINSIPFYELDAAVNVKEPNFKRSGGLLNKILFYPRLLFYLRKQIKIEKPNSVLCFGDLFNPLALMASKGLKVPVYISDRTSPDFKFPKHINWLKKIFYPKASGFIAQTQRSFDYKRKEFGVNFNQIIIPNAIREIKKYDVEKEKNIFFAGRFSWEKNPEALVRAFAQISEKGNWKLVMAGEGPQLKLIKNLTAELKIIEQVQFLGAISNIDEWLCRSSRFVLPSVLEGFPNALCEAMSAGLPVVCFDSIPYESLFERGVSGEVVPLGDIEGLSESLQKLMTDQVLRNQLGKEASKRAKNWKTDEITDQYMKFLKLS